MSNWIEIDPQEFEKPELLKVKGVDVQVFLSPYDIPRAVRGKYDEKISRFVIEFEYLDKEPTRDETHENLTLKVGENSARLYGIEIDANAVGIQVVGLRPSKGEDSSKIVSRITGALTSASHASEVRPEMFPAAKSVIEDKGELILSDIAGGR